MERRRLVLWRVPLRVETMVLGGIMYVPWPLRREGIRVSYIHIGNRQWAMQWPYRIH